MSRFLILVFTLSFLLVTWGVSFADEADLLRRIDALEEKVEDLNRKLSIYEKAPAVTVSEEVIQKKVDDILAKRQEEVGGVVNALKDITLSGFVDTSYTYNFNGPDSRANTARVFDTEANNFNLHAAEVVIERAPADSGGVGFRTDLFFGEDAKQIRDLDSSTADDFELEQAYITLKPPVNFDLPIGNWQWIKIGKFVTMHGAEVIESKDNWNFTRSLLFGYAIPFTHTGVRAGYQVTDAISGYLGINNGWDQIKDNNKTKSVEGALAWAAS